MSTVCARERQRQRGGACFFLCCGALFLHLTLRCDDDGDSDVFIAKNICAARHEEPWVVHSKALQVQWTSKKTIQSNGSPYTLCKPTARERDNYALSRSRSQTRLNDWTDGVFVRLICECVMWIKCEWECEQVPHCDALEAKIFLSWDEMLCMFVCAYFLFALLLSNAIMNPFMPHSLSVCLPVRLSFSVTSRTEWNR